MWRPAFRSVKAFLRGSSDSGSRWGDGAPLSVGGSFEFFEVFVNLRSVKVTEKSRSGFRRFVTKSVKNAVRY